ncbi:MAG: hypothetical protein ACYCX2_12115 [Christensenellales bacterium]
MRCLRWRWAKRLRGKCPRKRQEYQGGGQLRQARGRLWGRA